MWQTLKFPLCLIIISFASESAHAKSAQWTDFQETLSDYVTHLVGRGNYNLAAEQLIQADKYPPAQYGQLVSSVISKVYRTDNPSTYDVAACLDLLDKTDCYTNGFGIPALIHAMKNDSYPTITQPEILLVNSYVSKLFCSGKDFPVHKVQTEVTSYVTTVLRIWSSDIINGITEPIIQFVYQGPEHGSAVGDHLPKLISLVFNSKDTHAFNRSLTFVQKLPTLHTDISGYFAIVHELKNQWKDHSSEMMLVSHSVWKSIVRNQQLILGNAQLTVLFHELVMGIPKEVGNLFWKSKYTLKNIRYGEYLSANQGQVYTWVKTEEALWNVDKLKISENKLAFRFDSLVMMGQNQKGILCEQRNSKNVTLCTAQNTDYDQWYLQPVNLVGGVKAFLIKNSDLENNIADYLQATDDFEMETKRRMLGNGRIGRSSYWEIDCA